MEKKMSFGARLKEGFRKFIVGLKHRPQNIPLVVLVVTFLYFALNLSKLSNTTAKLQGPNMGLCAFVIMLFSMLSLVCFGNSFPRRKPVNKPMFILMFVMFAAIIAADSFYLKAIYDKTMGPAATIQVTESTKYIAGAYQTLSTHIVLLGVSILLIVLLPVYSKLIRKIKTSIEVETGGEMAAIDISSED